MNEHRRRGPIGWLFEAYQADPARLLLGVLALVLFGVLFALMTLFSL